MGDRQIAFERRHKRSEGHDFASKGREDQQRTPSLRKNRLPEVLKAKNSSVEIERITLICINDVTRVDGPAAFELGEVLVCQLVAEPWVAGRKGQDRASVVRCDKVVQSDKSCPA